MLEVWWIPSRCIWMNQQMQETHPQQTSILSIYLSIYLSMRVTVVAVVYCCTLSTEQCFYWCMHFHLLVHVYNTYYWIFSSRVSTEIFFVSVVVSTQGSDAVLFQERTLKVLVSWVRISYEEVFFFNCRWWGVSQPVRVKR